VSPLAVALTTWPGCPELGSGQSGEAGPEDVQAAKLALAEADVTGEGLDCAVVEVVPHADASTTNASPTTAASNVLITVIQNGAATGTVREQPARC